MKATHDSSLIQGPPNDLKSLVYADVGPSARWYKNEILPKSDDFRPSAVGTTHIIQLGHMMACQTCSKDLRILTPTQSLRTHLRITQAVLEVIVQ